MIRNIWPLNTSVSIWDKVARKVGRMPGYCNVCGKFTMFHVNHPNLREHVTCPKCQSKNRQRQIVTLLLSNIIKSGYNTEKFASIKDIPTDIVIWNTEASGAIHDKLAAHLKQNYTCSEYINPLLNSGNIENEILHVDIQNTHFNDNAFDYILSGDVMEHVPFPLKALEETYRILKPGGCHIFTVPFYHHRFSNETRAVLDHNGVPEYLRKPWYHDDPIHEKGVLVYTIFAPELLIQLEKIGFEARLCLLHSASNGILGDNGIVIVAKKSIPPDQKADWIFPPQEGAE